MKGVQSSFNVLLIFYGFEADFCISFEVDLPGAQKFSFSTLSRGVVRYCHTTTTTDRQSESPSGERGARRGAGERLS